MKTNKFIDHEDPTAPIPFDIDPRNIKYQYSKLSEREKLAVGSRLLGMDHVPCTFNRFLEDSYYLGNPQITNYGKSIFDIWKEVGEDVYPTPISTKTPYVSFGG